MADCFPDRLRSTLAEAGCTQAELAKAIACSERAIRGWLSGANSPKVPTLAAICLHFKVSSDWLLGLPKRRRAA